MIRTPARMVNESNRSTGKTAPEIKIVVLNVKRKRGTVIPEVTANITTDRPSLIAGTLNERGVGVSAVV